MGSPSGGAFLFPAWVSRDAFRDTGSTGSPANGNAMESVLY